MADQIITGTAEVIPDLTTSGGGGGGGAPTTTRYWVGAADAALSAEHDLGALATGLVKNTAGVPSIGVAGTDYQAPLTSGVDYQPPLTAGVNYEVPLTFNAPLSRAVNAVSVSNDGVTDALLRNSAALSVIGRSANSTGDPADIAGVTVGHVLQVLAGPTLGFGAAPAPGGFTDTALVTANGSGNLVSSPVTISSGGTLSHAQSSSGSVVTFVTSNTSNTASSSALIAAQVAGSTAADAVFAASISGGTVYTWGIDNSVTSDPFVLAASNTLGTSNILSYAGGFTNIGLGAPVGGESGEATVVIGRNNGSSYSITEIYSDQASTLARLSLYNSAAGTRLSIAANGTSTSGTFLGTSVQNRITMSITGTGVIGTSGSFPIEFGTNSLVRLTMSATGNLIIGTAALATTATDGFFYVSSSAGAPTGVPTAATGRVPIHYDTTNNHFYAYNTAWKKVALT